MPAQGQAEDTTMMDKGWIVPRTLALTALIAIISAANPNPAQSGQNEDWCFSDQERTDAETISGCTAVIGSGKLGKDKLATAYANRCLAHLQSKKFDRAIADCTEAATITPANAIAFAQRGEAYCRTGDIKRCVADFDEAMRIDPSDPSFVYLRGMARADAGDSDGAIADLTKAIDQDPETASAYARRGQLYEAEGDKFRAAADYRNALRIDPTDETTRQRLEAFRR